MKLKSLIELNAREFSALTGSELRKSYQQMKTAMTHRAQTFAKHGLEGRRMPSSRGLSESELRSEMRKAAAYMRGKRSSYSGYQQIESERLQRMQEAMPDMGFETEADLRKFGKFMNDMSDRFGSIKYDSNDARKLYKQAQRLNVDPDKFMRNYEYWMDHIEDLEKATPIKQREGSRALKPSDYARQIKGGRINRKGS